MEVSSKNGKPRTLIIIKFKLKLKSFENLFKIRKTKRQSLNSKIYNLSYIKFINKNL